MHRICWRRESDDSADAGGSWMLGARMLAAQMDLSRARDTYSGARVTSSLSLARGPDGEVVRPPMSGERSSGGLVGSSGRWTRELSSKWTIFLPGAYFHVGCIH